MSGTFRVRNATAALPNISRERNPCSCRPPLLSIGRSACSRKFIAHGQQRRIFHGLLIAADGAASKRCCTLAFFIDAIRQYPPAPAQVQ
jgi:hypothetical protein